MEFSCLTQIVNTEQDLDLLPTSSEWAVVDSSISVDHGWITEDEFNQCLGQFIGQQVFAFETFVRIYKSTNIQKRLEDSFVLSWSNFKKFQETTDILFVYVVSKQLNWVFYANRDKWYFAVHP
ncbi:hypothetical protein HG547_05875 [Shewanella sp. DNRA4]|uniref:hypothetical protein n=1 Tax=Shewanella TaxID=22 RepID=UPI00146CDB57|nr:MULTISPECIES: hypothetical protein [Shewanella]NMD51165.1 hypothetical protein [Shewanella sp. DNRA4]BDA62737.1 hypothetical protein NUITMVS1_42000 [Shewanella xiamenensis]